MFLNNSWTAPDARVMSHRGYAIRKDQLTPAQTRALRTALTMTPQVAAEFATGVGSFPIFYESPSRWYVPRFWGIENCGDPDGDARQPGLPLRDELQFNKTLRSEQMPIVNAFRDGGWNGLICVPCGYGKTFMAIWLACQLRRRFLIVVHQEFLMEQWRKELEGSIPGIRIGILQESKVQTGYMEQKPPTVAEIKERLRAHGLKVGGTRDEILARLREVEPEPEPVMYDCCICMLQTVASREWPADAFSGFGFTIFDECHFLGAEHFSKALMSIQTRNMLGLSATPKRMDGLDSVFLNYLGPIRYQIAVRDPDEEVEVRVLRFTSADDEYADTPMDCRGNVSRPLLCNRLADYHPRTQAICDLVLPSLKEGRQILILSDRRAHLEVFEKELIGKGITSIGYYVGGMKNSERDVSATKQVVLATFTCAAVGMNIPTLSAVALVTPHSQIEQAVGRVFRQKRDVRKFAPIIYDIIDLPHDVCVRQYRRRRQFYRQCAYKIRMIDGAADVSEGPVDNEEDTTPANAAAAQLPKGVPLFKK